MKRRVHVAVFWALFTLAVLGAWNIGAMLRNLLKPKLEQPCIEIPYAVRDDQRNGGCYVRK